MWDLYYLNGYRESTFREKLIWGLNVRAIFNCVSLIYKFCFPRFISTIFFLVSIFSFVLSEKLSTLIFKNLHKNCSSFFILMCVTRIDLSTDIFLFGSSYTLIRHSPPGMPYGFVRIFYFYFYFFSCFLFFRRQGFRMITFDRQGSRIFAGHGHRKKCIVFRPRATPGTFFKKKCVVNTNFHPTTHPHHPHHPPPTHSPQSSCNYK